MAERTPQTEGSLEPKRFPVVAVDTDANWTLAQAAAVAAGDVLQEAGEVGYASDTHRWWIADGTTDVDDLKWWCRPITKWITSDDAGATSDIDPANHPISSLASGTLPAASTWLCEFVMRFQGATAGDFRFDIDVTGTGPTYGYWDGNGPGTNITAADNVNTNWTSVIGSSDMVYGSLASPTDVSARLSVIVVMGSTSGVITPRYAQQTSNATATVLRRWSRARYTRIG